MMRIKRLFFAMSIMSVVVVAGCGKQVIKRYEYADAIHGWVGGHLDATIVGTPFTEGMLVEYRAPYELILSVLSENTNDRVSVRDIRILGLEDGSEVEAIELDSLDFKWDQSMKGYIVGIPWGTNNQLYQDYVVSGSLILERGGMTKTEAFRVTLLKEYSEEEKTLKDLLTYI